jgi:hypothetical protein
MKKFIMGTAQRKKLVKIAVALAKMPCLGME